jgi:hypothetical protein
VRLGDLYRLDRGWEPGPRAHPIPDLVEVSPQIGLELLEILTIHSRRALVGLDPPPRLPHHRLGNRKRLLIRAWHVASPPPRTPRPRLNESTFLTSQPLGSTATPESSGLTATTGRSASERRDWYSVPSVLCLDTLPLATFRACDPGRRIDTRLLTFRARAADQAHAAFTPDTTWPVIGTPARLIAGEQPDPPLSMPPTFMLTTPQQRTLTRSPPASASGTSSWSPPDAFNRAFSGSLTTTVFSQRSIRWFDASPRRATPEDRGRDRRHQRPPAQIPACALTHWAPPLGSGVKAHVRPGMKDPRLR